MRRSSRSRDNILQDRKVQHGLSHQLLQLAILILERLQTLRLRHCKAPDRSPLSGEGSTVGRRRGASTMVDDRSRIAKPHPVQLRWQGETCTIPIPDVAFTVTGREQD